MRQLACVVIVGALGCEAGSKPEAQQPERSVGGAPAAAEKSPTRGEVAKQEQVALGDVQRSGDPCEGGESVPTSGGGFGHGGLARTGAGKGGGQGAPVVKKPSDEVAAAGALDKATIDRVMRARATQVRDCYAKQLDAHPGLAGKLVVRLTIGTDGKVVSATATTSLQADVDACVLAVVKTAEFPAMHGIVVVSYPFKFSPP